MIGQFFAMGGYALYVWPAYGAAALAVGLLVWRSLRAHARAKDMLAKFEAAKR
jgi:heme exporter protein CcmD